MKEIVGIYSAEDREFHISRYEDGAFVLPSGECAAFYSLDEKSAKDKIILQIKHFYR